MIAVFVPARVRTSGAKLPKFSNRLPCVRERFCINLAAVNFEDYLVSKKIDSDAFHRAEGDVWLAWREEFDQLSATSFTAQKLYLINPVRRKYPLPFQAAAKEDSPPVIDAPAAADIVKPVVVAKPVFKPRIPGATTPTPPTAGTDAATPAGETTAPAAPPKPVVARPVMKPKISPPVAPPATEGETSPPTSDDNAPVLPQKPVVMRPIVKPKSEPLPPDVATEQSKPAAPPASDTAKPARPVIPRPVIKPKPKTE